ncbi:MAG: tyrosine-type recombinase/integrase [Streptosporangiaceae bacterium]
MVKVKKETLKDGTVRWRARGVSAGKWPNGKRRLVTITASTKKACEAEVARITGQVASGTYTARWDGTVAEVIDAYLKSAAFEREANTALSYSKALLPVRDRLGIRKARSITRPDIEALRDWMLAEGRRRGGAPGTGLGARSVRLTLGRLSAAFELACQDDRLAANPCRYVRLPSQQQREDTTWSEDQLPRFLTTAAADRLSACWLLSALGLRRGEVLGLRWSDVDLDAGTLTIARARVLVDAKVIEKPPKSRRSVRILPLFEPVTGALKALRDLQAIEAMDAGPAYANTGYVAADEIGEPMHPERYSDEFGRLCRQAGLPKIRLHDTRGTMNGIMERAGVPESLRAAWLGHTVAVNKTSYMPKPKDLTPVSDTIGRLFTAAAS